MNKQTRRNPKKMVTIIDFEDIFSIKEILSLCWLEM